MIWIRGPLAKVVGEIGGGQPLKGGVDHRGPDTIEPCPPVSLPGCSEGGSRDLLTVKAVGTHLRVVLQQDKPMSGLAD